ncbi:MAG: DEAD/DEAH box helicase [Rhodanobacter sp.]|nr:MAG: DEAD/DEAH box helicase [Rhodanobacter sp.]
MSFDSLGLAPALLRALADYGYTQPTPIQSAAIPSALAGHDLLAAAQTGTGKTAAFALPLLQKLSTSGQTMTRRPRALILTPTRELAAQIHDNFRSYGKHMQVSSTTIFGGVSMGPQINAMRRGVDIVIATPGRLMDHMQQRTLDLSGVETLILDEADRMLDMGFLPALKRILASLPKKRQTLLFSATFPPAIKTLALEFMHNAREISVDTPNAVATLVSHQVHPVDAARKRDLLLHLLSVDSRRQSLVFSRTKHGADKLVTFLNASGLRTAAIHGNKSQNARTRALSDFKTGRVTVLVATDIAARGIDIEQLPIVVNFDLPSVAEDYVHRIGRTGRAGMEGLAVSLVSHDESGLLHDIRKLLKQDIAINAVTGYEPSAPLRLDAGAPRPKQGGGGQRQPRQGKASTSARPNGYAAPGRGEHAAGNHKRRNNSRPAAKA